MTCVVNKSIYVIKIKTYKTVHTGPKRYAGGDQDGLISCEYQLYVFINKLYHRFELDFGQGKKMSLFHIFIAATFLVGIRVNLIKYIPYTEEKPALLEQVFLLYNKHRFKI